MLRGTTFHLMRTIWVANISCAWKIQRKSVFNRHNIQYIVVLFHSETLVEVHSFAITHCRPLSILSGLAKYRLPIGHAGRRNNDFNKNIFYYIVLSVYNSPSTRILFKSMHFMYVPLKYSFDRRIGYFFFKSHNILSAQKSTETVTVSFDQRQIARLDIPGVANEYLNTTF